MLNHFMNKRELLKLTLQINKKNIYFDILEIIILN